MKKKEETIKQENGKKYSENECQFNNTDLRSKSLDGFESE